MPENFQNESVSLGSMGADALRWATYGNPFFTTRLGTSGWDPAGSRWMSKLNRIMAPGSSSKYGKFNLVSKHGDALASYRRERAGLSSIQTQATQGREAAMYSNREAMRRSRAENLRVRQARSGMQSIEDPGGKGYARRRKFRTRMLGGGLEAGKRGAKDFGYSASSVDKYDEMLHAVRQRRRNLGTEVRRTRVSGTRAAKSLGFGSVDEAVKMAQAPARAGGVMNFFARVTGERTMASREAHIARQARTKYGNFKWFGDTFGKGRSVGVRHAAGMYGLGRVLTGASVAMLAYDFTKISLKPMEMLAEVGINARGMPRVQTGAGIRAPGVAATIRQQAIDQMQSSAFAPRNVIGQEASFLHV